MMFTKTVTIVLDDDPRDYLVWRQGSGPTVEIFDIQVGSERGKGKGRRLVELLLQQVPSDTTLVWAITRTTNIIAKQFYEKLGFRRINYLPGFYKDSGAVMYGRSIQ